MRNNASSSQPSTWDFTIETRRPSITGFARAENYARRTRQTSPMHDLLFDLRRPFESNFSVSVDSAKKDTLPFEDPFNHTVLFHKTGRPLPLDDGAWQSLAPPATYADMNIKPSTSEIARDSPDSVPETSEVLEKSVIDESSAGPLATILNDVDRLTEVIKEQLISWISYYINPRQVPVDIEAFMPRLEILSSRIQAKKKLNFDTIGCLMDKPSVFVATEMMLVIDQLLNAIYGMQELFENHYNTNLKQTRPLDPSYRALELHESHLKDLIQVEMTSATIQPEDLRPLLPVNLCKGAIQMLNGRDSGLVSPVSKDDLSEDNLALLMTSGGIHLWWQCQSCPFRLRYRVSNSMESSLHTTAEIRQNRGVKLAYRSTFLAKSHLESTINTDILTAKQATSSSPDQYTCLFCLAMIEQPDLKIFNFQKVQELVSHIDEKHRDPLPPALLLEQFRVGWRDQLPKNVKRWDVRFL